MFSTYNFYHFLQITSVLIVAVHELHTKRSQIPQVLFVNLRFWHVQFILHHCRLVLSEGHAASLVSSKRSSVSSSAFFICSSWINFRRNSRRDIVLPAIYLYTTYMHLYLHDQAHRKTSAMASDGMILSWNRFLPFGK